MVLGGGMKGIIALIVMLSLSLIGCSKQKLSPVYEQFMWVKIESTACSEKLYEKVKNNNAPYTFSFAYYIISQTTPVLNASFTQSEKRSVSYFISPIIDNNNPGSAWRACMAEKNIPMSHFIFLEINI